VPPMAMGECAILGLDLASFTLTEELYDAIPLDAVLKKDFVSPLAAPARREKRRLTLALAYLSHFYLGPAGTLYLIDLQRVGRRARVPGRYRVKDLGQLNYSADFTGGVSRTDRMRFFLAYLGKSHLSSADKALVRKIMNKTRRIARHDVKLTVRRRRRGEKP